VLADSSIPVAATGGDVSVVTGTSAWVVSAGAGASAGAASAASVSDGAGMPSRPITTGEDSSPYRAAEDSEDSADAEVADESSAIEGVGSSEPEDTTGTTSTKPVTAVLSAMPRTRRPPRRRRAEGRVRTPRLTAPAMRAESGGPAWRRWCTGEPHGESISICYRTGPTVSDS
jgi:hypothetical protein